MSKVFDEDPAQDRIVAKMVATTSGAAINGSGTGVGKTVVAVRVAHERGGDRVLIIAPPNTYENWRDTATAIAGADLRFCGNKALAETSKAEAQANMADAQDGKAGWYFVGREMFVKQQRVTVAVTKREAGKLVPVLDEKGKQKTRVDFKYVWGKKRRWGTAILDECQIASNRTSKSRQAFEHLQADFKLAQSADWWGTDLVNQHTMAKMLWPDWMNRNLSEWMDEYCVTEFNPHTYSKKKVTGEIWPGLFASELPCYVALPSPVEKPVPEKRFVDLSPAQRALYDKLAKDMAAEIDGDLMVLELPLHLDMRLRELALGLFVPVEVPGKDSEGRPVMKQTIEFRVGDPSTKIDEIKAIMKDYPGEHVLVATGSQKFAEKAAIELGGLPYTGKQTEKEKEEAKAKFLSGKIKVLVGTSAIAEGLDGLQKVCRLSIIASRFSVPYKNEQFLGRTARRGQPRPVVAFELIARGTKDAGIVHKSIETILRNNVAKSIEKRE